MAKGFARQNDTGRKRELVRLLCWRAMTKVIGGISRHRGSSRKSVRNQHPACTGCTVTNVSVGTGHTARRKADAPRRWWKVVVKRR